MFWVIYSTYVLKITKLFKITVTVFIHFTKSLFHIKLYHSSYLIIISEP